jgi:hypothetical protein
MRSMSLCVGQRGGYTRAKTASESDVDGRAKIGLSPRMTRRGFQS